MKITPIYKNRVITLPAETVLEKLSTASKNELAVLIAVSAAGEFEISEICEQLDMTENAFRRALNMWIDEKVLACDELPAKKAASDKKSVSAKTDGQKKDGGAKKDAGKVVLHSYLPSYSSDEISEIIETRRDCFELINECQQIMGKIFNASETSILIGMTDHLGLSSEYILLLCSHAVQMQKKSLRYIEQLAIGFYDSNIVTYEELEDELKLIEDRAPFESFVRTLFGIGKRTLIPKEREFIKKWHDEYKFSKDMISAAYEVTVSNTEKPSLKYANAVLDNWFAAGYTTIEDVRAAEEERAKKRENSPQTSSFSTEDFYEAALLRSYKEQK